ncbi:hypothetical protein RFY15_13880, partial [Acinetobacter baumannii]|nr:hypothetical protein [Acinetobacter baumannii]
ENTWGFGVAHFINLASAPAYLMKSSPIHTPEDLLKHEGIWPELQMNPWHFQNIKLQKEIVRPNIRFVAKDRT